MSGSTRTLSRPLGQALLFSSALGLSLNTQAQTAPPLVCTDIDNFQSSTIPLPGITVTDIDPGPTNVLDNAPSGVLGGFRNITYGPYAGGAGSSSFAIGALPGGSITNSNNVNGRASWSILYDANGAGLGLDLSGATSISLNLAINDGPDTTLEFVLTDTNSNSAQSSIINLPNDDQGDTLPVDLDFAIAGFTGVNALDLTSIASIQMSSNVTLPNSDLALSGLQLCSAPAPAPVPDPEPEHVPTLSTWSLLLLAGFLGLTGVFNVRREGWG